MKFLANANPEVQMCFTVAAVCWTILFLAPIFFKLDDKRIHTFKPSITKSKARNIWCGTGFTIHSGNLCYRNNGSHDVLFISILVWQQTVETPHWNIFTSRSTKKIYYRCLIRMVSLMNFQLDMNVLRKVVYVHWLTWLTISKPWTYNNFNDFGDT
jgi:hypothetical protein